MGVHPPEGDALMRYRTEVLASEAGRGLLARRGSEAAGGGGEGAEGDWFDAPGNRDSSLGLQIPWRCSVIAPRRPRWLPRRHVCGRVSHSSELAVRGAD